MAHLASLPALDSDSDRAVIEAMLEIMGSSEDHSPLALLARYQAAFPALPRVRLLQCASKASSIMLDALLAANSKTVLPEKA